MTVEYNPIFVRIEISRNEDRIKLKQEEYMKKVLKQFNKVKVLLLKNEEKNSYEKEEYREAIRNLLYLSTKIRADVSYGVGYCSRYMENYTQENINDIKHIMKYLNGITNQEYSTIVMKI